MAEPKVETMPDLEEDRQADGDDPTIPETKALEAKDRTAPENEISDQEHTEQQQQQQNDKFGLQVLDGEIQENDPHRYNLLTFE